MIKMMKIKTDRKQKMQSCVSTSILLTVLTLSLANVPNDTMLNFYHLSPYVS